MQQTMRKHATSDTSALLFDANAPVVGAIECPPADALLRLLQAWWTVHRQHHAGGGNAADARWRPRRNAHFAAALCLAIFCAVAVFLTYLDLLRSVIVPIVGVERASVLLAAVAQVVEPSTALSLAKCAIFLVVLCTGGFAYTNFVTTARRHPWRGLHGGLRDVLIVNASIPAIVACSLWPIAQLMFPHGFVRGSELGSAQWLLPMAPSPCMPSLDHMREDWFGLRLRGMVSLGGGVDDALERGSVPSCLAPTHLSAWLPNLVAESDTKSLGVGAWGATMVGTVVSSYPPLLLSISFLASLHILYALRWFSLDGSMSGRDVKAALHRGDLWTFVSIGLKLCFIGAGVALHIAWCVSHGLVLRRLVGYAAFVAALAGVTFYARHSYYFHCESDLLAFTSNSIFAPPLPFELILKLNAPEMSS